MIERPTAKSRAWVEGVGWSLKKAWELGIVRYDDNGQAVWVGEAHLEHEQ